MLKALELAGFKSFADKTRFEFPAGVTVVVGPNGSGKSNIVDAIKWVLGEQSVKSLRGKEMADVIFNGSGTRRAINCAEVTLTFDNTNNLLNIDTPEVHITRRVYRGGEGEYLINRNPCRLRDIRDLLAGTGMGTQAYSVIEQGKVDVLLQSSPRDRRLIFEEAAGISRFKARKLESLRRLERVEQNLLRLSDIVDEVDNRLRNVRLQAGKARRYKQYTDRLQELRTQVGLTDWRRLSDKLARLEEQLTALSDQRDASSATAEAVEARLLETDSQIGQLDENIRQSESRIADNRERIAAGDATIEHQRASSRDLQTEITRHRRQLLDMNTRAADLQQQLQETKEAVEKAERQHKDITQRLVEGERVLSDVMAGLDRIRGQSEQRRRAYMEQMRSAAALGNRISALESQLAAATETRQRSRQRMEELDRQIDNLAEQLRKLRDQQEQLSRQADDCRKLFLEASELLEQLTRRLDASNRELSELRQRYSGAAEKAAVLEELHRKHEGLSAGVKEVLAQAQNDPHGPFKNVRGLVADLFSVGVEVAPLIEVALGVVAQHVVVGGHDRLLDHITAQSQQFSGRVGFVWLEAPGEGNTGKDSGGGNQAGQAVNLEGRPGVLGRADRFVETQPQFAPLAERLLGRTWIVEKLSHAIELANSVGRHQHFVTLAGELLDADGTLVVGPQNASTGLISRRSQLRALHSQLADLRTRIDQTEQSVSGARDQISAQQKQLEARSQQHRQAADALAEHRFKIEAAEARRTHLDQQREVLEAELKTAVNQHNSASQQLAAAQREKEQVDGQLHEAEAGMARLNEQSEQFESQQQSRNRETTHTKVELAKSEERLRNLHARLRQFNESRQERGRTIADGTEQLGLCVRRADEARRHILRCESQIAELYLRKESFASQTVELINGRELLRRQRVELTAEAQTLRNKVRKLEEKIHAEDLAANEIRHQRSSLADRLRDDYDTELAELEHVPSDEEQLQREEVQEEIDDLRRKINNLGNVNLQALEELEQLESRHGLLASQYEDLVEAKASLEKIIDRINVDSRRLFAETLETVTGHFQKLFRDLFGGGYGDIALEKDVDILESGIEIVARPPGKEPRSISLLSGGEKTLTCVALLLAIFRSRPSPFCVLDEVDAALDEVNIDRFTQVIQDFLTWTQFIIVTHSKKTMTAADTIYGVTMQESGVSKQVSVRFEDVSDDGHIRPERIAEAENEAENDESQAA